MEAILFPILPMSWTWFGIWLEIEMNCIFGYMADSNRYDVVPVIAAGVP